MDLTALRAFLSPRTQPQEIRFEDEESKQLVSRKKINNLSIHQKHQSSSHHHTSDSQHHHNHNNNQPVRSHSTKLIETNINQYVRDLHSSIKNSSSTAFNAKSTKHSSSNHILISHNSSNSQAPALKESTSSTIHRSCQNLKKQHPARSLYDKHHPYDNYSHASTKHLNTHNANNTHSSSLQKNQQGNTPSTPFSSSRTKNKSMKDIGFSEDRTKKTLPTQGYQPRLLLNTETEMMWIPNKKLENLLGQVQTTTNLLAKTFDKENTPKPKTIKNLFTKNSTSSNNNNNNTPANNHQKSSNGLSPLPPSMTNNNYYPLMLSSSYQKYLMQPSPLATPSSLPISMRDFQIIRKLGKGRFGNVYLAQEKKTRFIVALKTISKKMLIENSMMDQLKQEIKIQLCMNHPNLLKMYGYFSDSENIYLIIEDALGGNVFRQLRDQKRFNEKKASVYLKQVMEGLSHLHNMGVLHRDIKPENILISNGVLKLSDFGWSVYSPEQARVTFCGTLDYVSPQIVVGKAYDSSVDVWGIGILCYEFVVGRPPFQTRNGPHQQTYDKIVRNQIEFPQYLSAGVKDFIARLLVKNPKKRMSIQEALRHPWLVENSKGAFSVSRNVFNSYAQLSVGG